MNILFAIKTILLCLFSSYKSKFKIDDFIAKEHYEIAFKDFFNQYLKNKIAEIEKLRIFNLNIIRISFIFLILIAILLLNFSSKNPNLNQFLAILFGILIAISIYLNNNFTKIYKNFVVNNIFKYFTKNHINYITNSTNFSEEFKDFQIFSNFNPTYTISTF